MAENLKIGDVVILNSDTRTPVGHQKKLLVTSINDDKSIEITYLNTLTNVYISKSFWKECLTRLIRHPPFI